LVQQLNSNDSYAAIRIKEYRWFVYARFLLTFAIQMQSVIVGWQVYGLTHDPISLGLVGLAEAIPFLSIALLAGHVADTINRKSIIIVSTIVYTICAAALYFVTAHMSFLLVTYKALPIYGIIFITGIARGFIFPAQGALSAQLVPKEFFGNAATWNSIAWHIAAVTGPAIGGLVCGFFGMNVTYAIVTVCTVATLLCFLKIKKKPLPLHDKEENIFESLSKGLKFVFSNQIVLSAISLDMFAVFFGGAVCVLPIFADQILHTGSQGLGFLRAAPAIGSICMSIFLIYFPPFKKAGRNLLFAVFGFGISIILFALSKSFPTAILALILSGMTDNVSVVIRGTIMQVFTPDEMRGRVSAVNSIFIGSSNELGSLESGIAAKLLTLIPSIIFGGSMTLAVVAVIRKTAPKLKSLNLQG
jgi:MFS family permease